MTSHKILLIDDDEDDCVLFLDVLGEIDSSLECDVANDGFEALRLLRTKDPLPDIIFLDLNMPKMNGYECLAEMQKVVRLRDLPVVMYTTLNIRPEERRTLQMGAKHFFTKPRDFKVFKKELIRLLEAEMVY